MISGLVEACLAGWLLLAANGTEASSVDRLLRSLARQPPQTVPFVEMHRSPLLDEDLVVSGELEYRGPGRLSRVVTAPYHERTDIDGTDVRIHREGRPERRFSLRRSAELGSLMSAFSALLGGNRTALEQVFEPRLVIQADGWQLDLVPRAGVTQGDVEKIVVQGKDDTPACISLWMRSGGQATVIRLGDAAQNTRQAQDCGFEPRDD
jgi:hypothetical protein